MKSEYLLEGKSKYDFNDGSVGRKESLNKELKARVLAVKKRKLKLSQQAFWDIDMESIQGKEEEYASWIIKRVAQYGTVDDMVSIDLFYSRDKIINVLNEMSESEREKSILMTTFIF